MDGGKKVGCEFVVSRCDAAEVLQPSEPSFDRVAGAIKNRAEWRLEATVCFGWNIRRGTAAVHRGPYGVGVIASICQQENAWWHLVEQQLGGSAVGNLAARERKSARATVLVGQRVKFGCASVWLQRAWSIAVSEQSDCRFIFPHCAQPKPTLGCSRCVPLALW